MNTPKYLLCDNSLHSPFQCISRSKLLFLYILQASGSFQLLLITSCCTVFLLSLTSMSSFIKLLHSYHCLVHCYQISLHSFTTLLGLPHSFSFLHSYLLYIAIKSLLSTHSFPASFSHMSFSGSFSHLSFPASFSHLLTPFLLHLHIYTPQDISTLSCTCIFDITYPSSNLFLVVCLEKVLQGNISDVVGPYMKDDAVSVCLSFVLHLSAILFLFFFTRVVIVAPPCRFHSYQFPLRSFPSFFVFFLIQTSSFSVQVS